MMIKVLAGGGGKGMCIVYFFDEVVEGFVCVILEVVSLFGDSCVFVEKFIIDLCYIEI